MGRLSHPGKFGGERISPFWLSKGPPQLTPIPPKRLPAASQSTGRAQVARSEKNRVVCRVNADSAGYLVLLDSYYPGWKATVDGRKAKILRANFAFRAVSVPGGDHTVEFRFVPWTFYCGMAVTLSTILGTGAFCTWTWIRRRRRKIQLPPAGPIVL